MGVKVPYEDDFFMKMIFPTFINIIKLSRPFYSTNFKSISNNSKRGKSTVQTD